MGNEQMVNITPPFRQRGDCHHHLARQQQRGHGGLISHGLLSHGSRWGLSRCSPWGSWRWCTSLVLVSRASSSSPTAPTTSTIRHPTPASSCSATPRHKPQRPEHNGLRKHLKRHKGPGTPRRARCHGRRDRGVEGGRHIDGRL